MTTRNFSQLFGSCCCHGFTPKLTHNPTVLPFCKWPKICQLLLHLINLKLLNSQFCIPILFAFKNPTFTAIKYVGKYWILFKTTVTHFSYEYLYNTNIMRSGCISKFIDGHKRTSDFQLTFTVSMYEILLTFNVIILRNKIVNVVIYVIQ